MTGSNQGVPMPPPWEEQDPLLPYPGYFPDLPEGWLKHRHRVDKARARAKRASIRSVFLGDSITEGWDTTLWNMHFLPYGAINLAIGGDKTCQILWRIADGLLEGLAPEVVYLAIGVNNIWSGVYSPERIGDGVLACVASIQAACPAAKVLVSDVLPCNESPGHPYRTVIRGINARIAPVADGKVVRFVDAGAALLEPDGRLPPSVAPDGVHLSFEGYIRIATVIAPAFKDCFVTPP